MTKIDWTYCQKNSDLILSAGLNLLQKGKVNEFNSTFPKSYGNYLISDKSRKWNYTGEAKNLLARLKQHSKENTSTFYKNYQKFENEFSNFPKGLKINQFEIRTVNTNIGRKELEEFGIVNIPAILNKFQKGKRKIFNQKVDTQIWNETQLSMNEILGQGERILMNSKSYNWFQAQIPSSAGLYWVENKSKGLIYIGESSNIFERYDTHSGKTYFSALRRHIGENILDFKLQTIKGRKRYFSDTEDRKVTSFLTKCTIKPFPINFGRYELEEYLIRKYKPLLNRKENK
jgi:predicted GIY-YIG superfamily endonuclease